MMDLTNVVIHNSPDVRAWKETVTIHSIVMRPGRDEGLSFEFSPQTWPDYTPPGWDGPIQYTVWPVVKVNGQWHTSGIIQMWRNRPSTGAPLLRQWRDWCYDGRWGAMVNYAPQAGDEVGFFLTAGNARGTKGVTSVAERSNVVTVRLPEGDRGVFTFAPVGVPSGPPPPAPQPPATPPQCKCDQVLEELKQVRALVEGLKFTGRVEYPSVSLWQDK